MTNVNRIEKIKMARQLIIEALDECGVPMIENALSEADMNLHWALWNMGEMVELLPELERR